MDDTDFELIQWSFDESSGIGRITLDRPEKLNALSSTLREEFVAGFEAFQRLDANTLDPSVRCVIVDGAGDRAFCAGADITEFDEREPVLFDDSGRVYQVCRRFPAPVVAMIDGYCLGGGVVLAVSCDFRFASDRSEFGLPEVEHGIVPGGGFIRQLSGLVGVSRAKELLMTGDRISATTAERDGLIDRQYPPGDLESETVEFAAHLSEADTATIRVMKDVANMSAGLPAETLYEDRTTQWQRGASWF